jgi:hypothetical protein
LQQEEVPHEKIWTEMDTTNLALDFFEARNMLDYKQQ